MTKDKKTIKEFFTDLFGKKSAVATTTQTRFPGITSFRELSVFAKNSASGADEAYLSYNKLAVEVNKLISQIAKLRNPSDADESTRDKLSAERAKLREERDAKERALALAKSRGLALEKAADEYVYLVYKLTHQKVNYRKTDRFAQPDVHITKEEINDFIELFSGREKLQAKLNMSSFGRVFETAGSFFVKKQ